MTYNQATFTNNLKNNSKNYLKYFVAIIAIITSVVSGVYGYLLIDNPIDKEVKKIFAIYKNEGDVQYLQSKLNKFASDEDYRNSEKDLISGIEKICQNFKSANNSLKSLDVKSELLINHTKDFISSNEKILTLCQNPSHQFYYDIGQPIENITTTTNQVASLLDRKYKLKNTVVDRYPILSILVFIMLAFLIFLLVKKPDEWASYSINISTTLFIALTILAIGLNPLYSLLVLVLIAYIGFLLIVLNRKKS